jgi:GNAT superfamily N-acetyltransferase
MAGPTHLELPEELRELVKAQIRADHHAPGFLGEAPEDELPEAHDEEEALFADHDRVRGHGRGAYVFDAAEARSRSLDLRGTPDPDRGPIPLPPGAPAEADRVLRFRDEATPDAPPPR